MKFNALFPRPVRRPRYMLDILQWRDGPTTILVRRRGCAGDIRMYTPHFCDDPAETMAALLCFEFGRQN